MIDFRDIKDYELMEGDTKIIVTTKDNKSKILGVYHKSSEGILCDDDTYIRTDIVSIMEDIKDLLNDSE